MNENVADAFYDQTFVRWQHRHYHWFMTAADLIKQLKALPAGERRKLVKVILSLEDEDSKVPAGRLKMVKWPDVEARARRIFGRKVHPNLILSEREEASP